MYGVIYIPINGRIHVRRVTPFVSQGSRTPQLGDFPWVRELIGGYGWDYELMTDIRKGYGSAAQMERAGWNMYALVHMKELGCGSVAGDIRKWGTLLT